MRIVSWNMGANSVRKELHDAAWRHLLDRAELNADLALVQEAILPAWLSERHQAHWLRAWPNAKGQRWGTGIVATKELRFSPLHRVVPDTRFAMARLITDHADFAVASIHAFTSMSRDLFSDDRSLRFVDRLQANFDAIRDQCTDRFIVGGDLNTGRSAETTWPGQGHGEFWAYLDAAGFQSCPWSISGNELTTYRHPSGPFVGQADHILLDALTAKGVTATGVSDVAEGFSDHRALVVDLS